MQMMRFLLMCMLLPTSTAFAGVWIYQAGGNWVQAPVSEQATVAQELEQEPADDLAVELDGEEAEEAQELAE